MRLGPDTFFVPRDNTCQTDAGDDAAVLADFRVSELIGGINSARSTSVDAIINGEPVWRYDFTADDLNLISLRVGSNGRIVNMSGEMWVSAEHNVVIRYWLTMDVENVVVTVLSENPDTALPVTGQLLIRYDVYDIGIDPNISQPFGMLSCFANIPLSYGFMIPQIGASHANCWCFAISASSFVAKSSPKGDVRRAFKSA